MHPVRRRKKRPSNGIRTIEVCRGSNGFGFTISGQQPCILSCIVRDSPADRAGLRSGDYLVAVNGQNVSKVSHDDVVRLIGCSSGLLKLQIAENYYSDSSDDDHLVSVRSKPKHAHKTRNGRNGQQQNRIAKVVRDLRSGVMFDKQEAETAAAAAVAAAAAGQEESWQLPDIPPPRYHPFLGQPKEELCFFLGYLGTIEMPKLIQPGSRSQVVRCCVKRMRAEKRSHTWVVMRVHAEGVTLTGAGGSLLADYPVHRICFCGPSADEDRKYVGLITSSGGPPDDATPSSSCHIFAVQSSLADHDKHLSKVAPFKISCTLGPLSDGCFEFPSTSESVLNAVRSFCLTKDEDHQLADDQLVMANSPQPSQAGSIAASSNSDSGIGFRDDCGNQSDRIVMVDIENQRLHIQQLCDDGKTLDIQLAGSRRCDAPPSANLQQAFACVSALCPLPGELDASELLSQRLTVRTISQQQKCVCDSHNNCSCCWQADESIFEPYTRSGINQSLSVSYGDGDVVVRNTIESKSSRSIYFQSTDSFDVDSYKLSPKVFGLPRPLITQSMEELATAPPPPAPPQLWGSLQHLPLHSSYTNTNEAIDDKEDKQSCKNEECCTDNAPSFEKLLADPCGLETFREFLKKEFSEENMTFWRSCEEYGELGDPIERRRLARDIFDAHLAEGAPEPVNVDAHARQHALLNLESTPVDLFASAQKQIFNLMKFDTFPRFLKSHLYQEYLGENGKLKKSQSDVEDRRRKSLLPWARKNRSKSKDRGEAELQLTLGRKMSEDAVSVGSRTSLASWDVLRGSPSRQSLISRDGDANNAFAKIVLADGATAVVQLRAGETVRELIDRVLTKRGLSYKAFDVYSMINNKLISLDEDSINLAKHQVRLEQRVMFRLDLPNRKTVSVKAKATKTLAQVLRPVLHKYNYQMDLVTICSVSENTVLELSAPIATVDGRRLTVLTRSASTMPNTMTASMPTKTFVRAGTSLDEITNKVFEEVLQGKSSCTSSTAGSVRSETSTSTIPLPRFLRRDSALEKLGLRNYRKSGKQGTLGSDSDDLYEGLKRAQRSRLEDQRGTEINFELPEFLKDKENSPTSMKKMRKIRLDAVNNAEDKESVTETTDAKVLKPPTGQIQAIRTVTCKTYDTSIKNKMSDDENKKMPPPLPPKPKLYNHNNFIKLNRSRRAAYLDQTSGSFV